MGRGWASNSKYSYLGALRSVAQSVSYEVRLALIIIIYFFLIFSLNISYLINYQKEFWFRFLIIPIFLIWMIRFLAELNRSPFDFAEGESELVSGFNIEYSSIQFGVIFISEYIIIIFISYITSILIFGALLNIKLFYIIFLIVFFYFMDPRFYTSFSLWLLNRFMLKNFFTFSFIFFNFCQYNNIIY